MIVNGQALIDCKPIRLMDKEKSTHLGVSHGLGEAGYDIRIAQTIHFRVGHTKRYVVDHEGVKHHGNFVLASAMEEFQMPPHLVGVVHDKSSWARKGLSVFNTVIEPNWKGWLTLELVYHGNSDLVIPAGAGIAQVLFHQLAENAYYDGKYQNQPNRPVAAR